MANTYIVSGSQFKPYTFDEMIKPALMYKQAYEDTEKKLESLEELGIDENSFLEQDAASKELYNNYMNQLQQTADALSNGYNAEVAKQARNLHKTFKTKINPMKNKLAIRAALTEEQRKLKNANPYLEFSKDYSTAALDDITETSTYKTRDLSKISSEIAADMTKFIASMTPEFTPDTISGVGNTLTTKYGYTPKEAYTQIKTEGTELNEKFKKYLDKYKDTSFSDDKLINIIESTMMSNAGASDTQFIKSKNDSTGGYWLTVGNKAYYMSESGTAQLEADWDGNNRSNIKKFSNSSSRSGSNERNTKLDFATVWIKDNGELKIATYNDFVSGEEKQEDRYLTMGTKVTGELPPNLKTFMENNPYHEAYYDSEHDKYTLVPISNSIENNSGNNGGTDEDEGGDNLF